MQLVVNLRSPLFRFGRFFVIFIRALRFRADVFLDGLELLIFKLFALFEECVWRLFFFKIVVKLHSDSLAALNFD